MGTAASNLNLQQNPLAHALSQAAGPNLQQECTKIGPTAVGDIAVNNQPGNLNCKAVIFAICCEWESGKGKKVRRKANKNFSQLEGDNSQYLSVNIISYLFSDILKQIDKCSKLAESTRRLAKRKWDLNA